MRAEDIPAGLHLCRAASWNQLAADWELFLAASPGGCRVATGERGEVVGSSATISYGGRIQAGSQWCWSIRRAAAPGLSTQLLKESLAIVGDTTARLDATPAGQKVYVPLGFREEYGLQRMTSTFVRKTQASFGETGSDKPHVRRMSGEDFVDVSKQDPAVFGGDRRMLLNRVLSSPGVRLVTGDNRIDGYLFGRPGFSFEHLGPLVAQDELHARALIRVHRGPRKPIVCDRYASSAEVVDELARSGRLHRATAVHAHVSRLTAVSRAPRSDVCDRRSRIWIA